MNNTLELSPSEYNKLISLEAEILELVASHEKTTTILQRLCYLAEEMLPNSVASIMLRDQHTGTLSILCAPSIPKEGHDALKNLTPGPGGGSCGNAVYKNEPQFVTDTFNDPRWEDIRDLAIDFNLCACWSMPIRDISKNAIGSFALSSFEHREPSNFHKKLLESASKITSIVLKNQATEQKLKLFATAMKFANEGVIITDLNNKIIEMNAKFKEIYKYEEDELLGENPKILSSGKNDKNLYKLVRKQSRLSHL